MHFRAVCSDRCRVSKGLPSTRPGFKVGRDLRVPSFGAKPGGLRSARAFRDASASDRDADPALGQRCSRSNEGWPAVRQNRPSCRAHERHSPGGSSPPRAVRNACGRSAGFTPTLCTSAFDASDWRAGTSPRGRQVQPGCARRASRRFAANARGRWLEQVLATCRTPLPIALAR